jgi:hypothetical protein
LDLREHNTRSALAFDSLDMAAVGLILEGLPIAECSVEARWLAGNLALVSHTGPECSAEHGEIHA